MFKSKLIVLVGFPCQLTIIIPSFGQLKLVNPSQYRFEHLVTQMKWRLQEGRGEAVYQIGVEDNGLLVGLSEEEMRASLKTLRRMAEKYVHLACLWARSNQLCPTISRNDLESCLLHRKFLGNAIQQQRDQGLCTNGDFSYYHNFYVHLLACHICNRRGFF